MRSLFIALCIFLNLTIPCAYSAPLQTGSNSGFLIYKPDERQDLGTTVVGGGNNTDPDYPYWGSCGVPTKALCWPETVPSEEYTLNKEADHVSVYLAFGPGEGTATINYDGEQKKFMFNALDKRDRTRYYRVQLKGEYTLEGNNCGSFMNFDAPKLVSESSATRVITFRTGYSNAVDKGACEVFLKSTPTTATRTVSVSLGALDFRISLGIYDVLPSGKHLFSVTLNDYIRIKERKNNVVINDRLAAGPVYVSGYINLKASLSFRLLSDAGKTMMFDPNNTVVDFFRVQGEFKTNFLAITTTVNCQYIHEGKCALFDGNSYLPLSIGVRSDYLVRNTSTVTLKPGVPQKLTGPLGFKIGTKAPIQYMFGLSREDVMANPASFGREFSGDVTMIVEGDF